MNRTARVMSFPLVWMVLGAVGVGVVAGLTATSTALAVPGGVAAVALYWAVMRYAAHRRTPELAREHAVSRFAWGAVVGAGFFLASLAMVLTEFTTTSAHGHPVHVLVSALTINLGGAVTEEIMFRGLALQAIEELAGSWVALGVTAALFGLAHLFNPDGSLWSSFAIAVEAGVMLGAAFLLTRSIWFVTGLHFAWNTVEQLLGVSVSGHVDPGFFVTRGHGPELLTGGSFGIEASIAPVLVSLVLAVPMLVLAHRRGNLVPLRRPRHVLAA